jgi:hypothetical protein
MFAGDFPALLQAAGVSLEELHAVIERGDAAEYAALVERVIRTPAALQAALQGIRRGHDRETQN